MRTPNLGTAVYTPGVPPTDREDLERYLMDELQRVAAAIAALAAGHVDMVTVAPTKPRAGDIRFADGTKWNPGSGKGFYGYDGATWKLLG